MNRSTPLTAANHQVQGWSAVRLARPDAGQRSPGKRPPDRIQGATGRIQGASGTNGEAARRADRTPKTLALPLAILLLMPALLPLLAGCDRSPEPVTRNTTRLLMGALVSITTWEKTDDADAWSAHEADAVAAAFQEMARVEALMSSHIDESAIGRINQAPRGTLQPLPVEAAPMIRTGLRVGAASGGAFDMGLRPLIQLWGFSREPPPTRAPASEAIEGWRILRGAGGLILADEEAFAPHIRLDNAGVGLDLGGIAKGYALDRAAAVLKAAGLDNFLVNAGGDLRAGGSKGDLPWRIGIQHPRESSQVIAAVELVGPVAMVTSGDYERFFIQDGVRYHHILDPRTGWPARSGLISASVKAPEAMLADALCTAMIVLGPEAAMALVDAFPGAEALLVLEDGSVRQSPGFQGARLGGS